LVFYPDVFRSFACGELRFAPVLLLTQFYCSFLLLAQKKRTKEKGSLKSFLGLPFCRLPTQYNSLSRSKRDRSNSIAYLMPFPSHPPKCPSFSKKDLVALLALRRYGFDCCYLFKYSFKFGILVSK
jgi:hypothetical protein